MRKSEFNLKRNTNPNKIEKKRKNKKFEQSILQNSEINFLICVANFVIVLTLIYLREVLKGPPLI